MSFGTTFGQTLRMTYGMESAPNCWFTSPWGFTFSFAPALSLRWPGAEIARWFGWGEACWWEMTSWHSKQNNPKRIQNELDFAEPSTWVHETNQRLCVCVYGFTINYWLYHRIILKSANLLYIWDWRAKTTILIRNFGPVKSSDMIVPGHHINLPSRAFSSQRRCMKIEFQFVSLVSYPFCETSREYFRWNVPKIKK